MDKRYTSSGIVLVRRNYSEADRIIKIFTPDRGKVTLLAKGIRKLKSRKRGSLEVFSKIKFSASQTKTFDIITEVDAQDLYNEIRASLRRSSLAYYFVEVVEKITADSQRHELVYEYLVEFMERLKTSKSLKTLRMEFVYKILVCLGFWPSERKIENADSVLAAVLERNVNSVRVGKAVLK